MALPLEFAQAWQHGVQDLTATDAELCSVLLGEQRPSWELPMPGSWDPRSASPALLPLPDLAALPLAAPTPAVAALHSPALLSLPSLAAAYSATLPEAKLQPSDATAAHSCVPQPVQTAAAGGAAMAAGTMGSTSPRSSESELSTEQARKQRTRERNRLAMQRFRKRSKERSDEAAAEQAKKSSELETLRQENHRLQARLADVEHASLTLVPSASPGGAHEWHPERGWDDFSKSNTLVISLCPIPGQPPLRLTQEQIQQITAPQLSALGRAYCACTSHLVPAVRKDPHGAEAQQLWAYTEQLCGLAAMTCSNSTQMLYSWMHQHTEPATMQRMLAVLQLTPVQQAALLTLQQLAQQRQALLDAEQRLVVHRLQGLTQALGSQPGSTPAEQLLLDTKAATAALAAVQGDRDCVMRAVFATAACNILGTLQIAVIMQHTTLWPDIFGITATLQQQQQQAASSGLAAQSGKQQARVAAFFENHQAKVHYQQGSKPYLPLQSTVDTESLVRRAMGTATDVPAHSEASRQRMICA